MNTATGGAQRHPIPIETSSGKNVRSGNETFRLCYPLETISTDVSLTGDLGISGSLKLLNAVVASAPQY